jgi:hypothetical protein
LLHRHRCFGLLTATLAVAATIAAHAPAAHAQGTPFGERAGDDTPFGKRGDGGSDEGSSGHRDRPRRQPEAQPDSQPAEGSNAEVSPLLRELAALNAKRASAIAASMSDRNRRDISTLSFLKKRAQSSANIDALKAISAAESAINKNRRITTATLNNKDLQKQYDSLRDTRAKHITSAIKTAANRLKPEYEKLLKRAIALGKYADAETIKRAIDLLGKSGDPQRFIGTWRDNGSGTFIVRQDGTCEQSWDGGSRSGTWKYLKEEDKLFLVNPKWYLVEEDENTLVEENLNPGKRWRRVR